MAYIVDVEKSVGVGDAVITVVEEEFVSGPEEIVAELDVDAVLVVKPVVVATPELVEVVSPLSSHKANPSGKLAA